ncbi:MAG: MFS transporter [Acidimicrobiia bacterium]|nr:MFS transporter [Acidimicrobiia bacterium]
MSLHRRSRLHLGHVRWHHRWHLGRGEPLGRDFGKAWAAGVSSNIADGITFAALPLLSAGLTREPALIALVALVHSLPWLGFELIAGEIVDRVDRRRLMLFGNLARAIIAATIAVLASAGEMTLGLLYVLAFGLGVAETLVDTSWEAIIPRLVPRDRLESANGRTQAAEWVANDFIGPPVGGALFAGAAAAPFFLDAGAFVLAALLVAWIPGTFRADREVDHSRGAARRDIIEGISWLWHQPVLRTLSAAAGWSNLVGTAMLSVFVLFAQDILELSDWGFGAVLAATGVGGILGAATAHIVERRIGPGTLLLSSVGGMALAALAVATTSNPVVVGAAFALDGFLIGMWNVVVVSLRQAMTPDEMRGRVASVARTVAFGAIPIGAAVGGVLAEISLRAPYWLGAGTYVVAAVLMSRTVNNRTIAQMKSA